MDYPVIVRSGSPGEFIAEPVGIPHLQAVAASEAEAVEQVENALAEWLSSAKLIHVHVLVPNGDNPWLKFFGRSANDPDFDEFVQEVDSHRASAE